MTNHPTAIRDAIYAARSDADDYGIVFDHGNDQRALVRGWDGPGLAAWLQTYSQVYTDELYRRFAHATPERVIEADRVWAVNRATRVNRRTWLERELAAYVIPKGQLAARHIVGVVPGGTCADCGMLVPRIAKPL